MKKFNYDENIRVLDHDRYYYNSICSLLGYRDDKMIEANKTRLIGNIDSIIRTLEKIKSDIS